MNMNDRVGNLSPPTPSQLYPVWGSKSAASRAKDLGSREDILSCALNKSTVQQLARGCSLQVFGVFVVVRI